MNRWTLACLTLATALAGCHQAAPQIDVTRIVVQKLDLTQAEYLVTCQVGNPNDWPVRVEDVRWKLFSGSAEVSTGTYTCVADVAARGTAPLAMPLVLTTAAVTRAGMGDVKQFPFRLEAQVGLSSPMGPTQAQFRRQGQMPLLHPLGIELLGMQLLSATETRLGLVLTVRVTNPNNLALIPSHLTGQLHVSQQSAVDVDSQPETAAALAPGQSGEFRFLAWAQSPSIGVKALTQLLLAPDARCRLTGAMQVRLPADGDVSDLLSESP